MAITYSLLYSLKCLPSKWHKVSTNSPTPPGLPYTHKCLCCQIRTARRFRNIYHYNINVCNITAQWRLLCWNAYVAALTLCCSICLATQMYVATAESLVIWWVCCLWVVDCSRTASGPPVVELESNQGLIFLQFWNKN